MENKITIIGSGAMGTALAKVIYDSGYKNIVIYGIDEQELNDLKQGKNLKYFPENTNLPQFITTNNLKEALKNTNYILIAVPSKIVDKVIDNILINLETQATIINASKGFYPNTFYSLQEGIKKITKNDHRILGVVSLLGPSHAEEIVKEMLTIVSIVDNDLVKTKNVQKFFNNKYFRTYQQVDEIGSEVGGAYKNILAIASGMMFASGYGINTVAALLTRGLAEAQRLNKILGGKEVTLMGLTGIGDLIVTALSPLSRNYTFGQSFIAKGKEAFETKNTVEGLTAIDAIYQIAETKKIDLPIVFALYDILYKEKTLKEVIEEI